MCLPDYRYDPNAYELEERSRPDEMLLLDRFSHLSREFLDRTPRAKALDLCCGTGLSIAALGAHPNLDSVLGVDVCLSYLLYARTRFSHRRRGPALVLGDAVGVLAATSANARWDLITMSSAYHHIDDPRKVEFLRSARSRLTSRGRIVMAENVLPPYSGDDPDGYRLAVERFYTAVLETMTTADPGVSPYALDLVRRVAKYGVDGDYEYKVCMSILVSHLAAAGLRVINRDRVWPESRELEANAGNFVFLLEAA